MNQGNCPMPAPPAITSRRKKKSFALQRPCTVSRQLGRTIAYRDLPAPEYQRALVAAGLPEGLASALADSDAGVARGELDDRSQQLRALLGRPSTSLQQAVASALAGLER